MFVGFCGFFWDFWEVFLGELGDLVKFFREIGDNGESEGKKDIGDTYKKNLYIKYMQMKKPLTWIYLVNGFCFVGTAGFEPATLCL